MIDLARLQTAVDLKRLRDAGLTNADIIQLVRADGWAAVRALVVDNNDA